MKNRTNADWMRELEAQGPEQAAAIEDLRAYLLRAALYSLNKKRSDLAHLGIEEIRQLGEDAAQDALVAILKHLHEFRSDSKFTTWAFKFAVNFALVAARHECWRHVSLDQVLEAAELPAPLNRADPSAINPDRAVLQSEVWATLNDIIEHSLTKRQAQALKAIVFEDVPLDEVARHWGSNRNAVYKLLHDSRHKLKTELEARGMQVEGVLALFTQKG